MNNINCEHCGAVINVEKDIKCPNCGAPFKNNKQYKEYKEYLKRQKEINLESQKIANDIQRDVHNTSKKAIPAVFIFVIVIFFIAFSFFIIIFKTAFSSMDDYQQKYDDYIKNKEYIDYLQKDTEKLYIFFNEFAYTDQYDIKVDKVVKYQEKLYSNKEYYGFHIVFKNKSSEWQPLSNIQLIYKDENGKDVIGDRGIVTTETLDYFAYDEETYEGYIYYEIPEEVKDVTIKFENIYITIFDFKNKVS